MTPPHQLSLEALIAEEGLCVSAGVPESLRRQLDAGRKLEEQAGAMRGRAVRIPASIAEHQAQVAKRYEELREVLIEYTAVKTAPPPGAAITSAA